MTPFQHTAKWRWVALRLLRGRGDEFLAAADEAWEMAPAESAISQPALYPEGELDKIVRLAPQRKRATEEALWSGQHYSHAATRAYRFSDVTIVDDFVYRGSARVQYGAMPSGHGLKEQGETSDLAEAHLVSCHVGAVHFGHFMWDNLPMELLPDPGAQQISLCHLPRWHEDSYRSLLDIPAPKVIRRGHIGQLTLYNDIGQNAYRARRYRVLRQRLRAALSDVTSDTPRRGVFILRGATGEYRELVNADALAVRLTDQGFDVLDPDRLSGAEMARRTLDARIVIGVDGSHIAHALYSVAPGGTFVILQPPTRFSMVYKEFTDRLDMRFAFLVGTPVAGGFHINPNALDGLLDRVA